MISLHLYLSKNMLPQLISMGDTIYVVIGCLPWLVVAAVRQRISAEGRHINVLIVLFHCQDNGKLLFGLRAHTSTFFCAGWEQSNKERALSFSFKVIDQCDLEQHLSLGLLCNSEH